MSTAKRTLLSELIQSLRAKPHEWRWGQRDEQWTVVHETGLQIWVSNGEAHLYKPHKLGFGFIGYLRLRSAFRRWRRVRGRPTRVSLDERNATEALAMFRGEQRPENVRRFREYRA